MRSMATLCVSKRARGSRKYVVLPMPKQTTRTFRGGDGSAASARCAIILVTGVSVVIP